MSLDETQTPAEQESLALEGYITQCKLEDFQKNLPEFAERVHEGDTRLEIVSDTGQIMGYFVPKLDVDCLEAYEEAEDVREVEKYLEEEKQGINKGGIPLEDIKQELGLT